MNMYSLNNVLNDEVCDARNGDSSTKAGNIFLSPDSRLTTPDSHYTSSQKPIFPNFSIRLLMRSAT